MSNASCSCEEGSPLSISNTTLQSLQVVLQIVVAMITLVQLLLSRQDFLDLFRRADSKKGVQAAVTQLREANVSGLRDRSIMTSTSAASNPSPVSVAPPSAPLVVTP